MADDKGIFIYEPVHLLLIDVEKVVSAVFGARLSELSKVCSGPTTSVTTAEAFVSELNVVHEWNASRVRDKSDRALSMCPDMEARYLMALEIMIRETPHLLERFDIHLDKAPAFHEFLHRVLVSIAQNSAMQTSRYFTHIIERRLSLQQAVRDALAVCLRYTEKVEKGAVPEPDPSPGPPAAAAIAEPSLVLPPMPALSQSMRGITVSELVRQATMDDEISAEQRRGIPHLVEARSAIVRSNSHVARASGRDAKSALSRTHESRASRRDAKSALSRTHGSRASRRDAKSALSRTHRSGASRASRASRASKDRGASSHVSRISKTSRTRTVRPRAEEHPRAASSVSRASGGGKSRGSGGSRGGAGRGKERALFSNVDDGKAPDGETYADAVTVLFNAPARPLNSDSATHYMELIAEQDEDSEELDGDDDDGDEDDDEDEDDITDSPSPAVDAIELDLTVLSRRKK